jgi:hypothetical protein
VAPLVDRDVPVVPPAVVDHGHRHDEVVVEVDRAHERAGRLVELRGQEAERRVALVVGHRERREEKEREDHGAAHARAATGRALAALARP